MPKRVACVYFSPPVKSTQCVQPMVRVTGGGGGGGGGAARYGCVQECVRVCLGGGGGGSGACLETLIGALVAKGTCKANARQCVHICIARLVIFPYTSSSPSPSELLPAPAIMQVRGCMTN